MRDIGFPEDLQIDTPGPTGGRQRLLRVGPALTGAIYRPTDGSGFYRLVPIAVMRGEFANAASWALPPGGRNMVRSLIGKRRAGLAAVEDEGQAHAPQGLYFVRYGADSSMTMADVLRDGDVRARVGYTAGIVASFKRWTEALGRPPLPMPAEIVLVDGTPQLLPMPYQPPWGLGQIASEPERGWYLAPELVRGDFVVDPRFGMLDGADTASRYALGVTLLRCFYELRRSEAPDLLQRVANGTVFAPGRTRSSMPAWVARVEGTSEAIIAARGIVARDPAAREGLDTVPLAAQLQNLAARMEPLTAVTELRKTGRTAEAFSLLQDALLERESYELLMVGGDLARDLDHPLEAVDLFERAIGKQERPQPYERQLEIILPILSGGALADVFIALTGADVGLSAEGARLTGDSLEERMLRDYGKLTPEQRERFDEPIARTLLARGRFEAAASLIRASLFDGEKYLWWKFGMAILYAEALFAIGGPENERHAETMVQHIKGRLTQVRENRSMDPREIEKHGRAVVDLEVRMVEGRSVTPPAASAGDSM